MWKAVPFFLGSKPSEMNFFNCKKFTSNDFEFSLPSA